MAKESQVNYLDPLTNISYLFSINKEMLIISVVDEGPNPNASTLAYLTEKMGEPLDLYAKPWTLDPTYTILFMFWHNPDFSWLWRSLKSRVLMN